MVPACTFPYAEGGAAYCFPNRLAYALYTPDNTGCATAVAEAYGLPPSPLTAAAQHVDAIQAACSAAATQVRPRSVLAPRHRRVWLAACTRWLLCRRPAAQLTRVRPRPN